MTNSKFGAWGRFYKKGKNGKAKLPVKGSGFYLGVYKDRFIFSYGEGLPFFCPMRKEVVISVDSRGSHRISHEHVCELRAYAILEIQRWVKLGQLGGR